MPSNHPVRHHPAHPQPISVVNRPTIIFLTVCTDAKRPILANEQAHELLRQTWTNANKWSVGRYVIMPNHVHLFCSPSDTDCTIKNWISYWRNMSTRNWPVDEQKPVWQRDFWDMQLRVSDNYHDKWLYVRNNPVRAGLVSRAEDWPYAGEINVLRW
jgi:putative transposase